MNNPANENVDRGPAHAGSSSRTMSREPATGKTVRLVLDAKVPPEPSDEAKARLARLSAMPDREIDFSDIPRSPADARWVRSNAEQTNDWQKRIAALQRLKLLAEQDSDDIGSTF